MTRRRLKMSGRRAGPQKGSVQRFAETVISMPHQMGLAFSMIIYRNATPTGCERDRAGR
jgi:hypothetical protein